jgi:hypothetical protein
MSVTDCFAARPHHATHKDIYFLYQQHAFLATTYQNPQLPKAQTYLPQTTHFPECSSHFSFY